ncbi:hypothetical protein PI126_g11967 [Phytophthora idaei]|nr:hypothetical protein PI126_g11967 [Phytophthora idaei]
MLGLPARWAELKKEGWDSKKPVGLSDDYTYLKPGKTQKDIRGVDYFVGEEELMRYLDRLDIETAAKAKKASNTPGEDPQPVQDPTECMAYPTDRTESPIGRKNSRRKLEMVHECKSTPRLDPDPAEASIVRGDPREDAPGETEDPTRNLDEQCSIVSDGSADEEPLSLHELLQFSQISALSTIRTTMISTT